MKKYTIIICLIALASSYLYSQNYDKNWGLQADYGSIEYRGELGDQFGDFSQWQGGYGVQIARYVNSAFDVGLRGGYNFLNVMGPDTFTYTMKGDMFTVMGNIKFKFANGVTINEDALFKPYIKVEGGKMFGKTWGNSMDLNGGYYQNPLNDWIYSLNGGMSVRLSEHINAFVEVGNLWVTAVGMDGSKLDASSDQFIRLNAGISFAMGTFKDSDRDGVADRYDQCPDTPPGIIVDEVGCPLDSDGDGVPDYLDKCPDEFGSKETEGCPDRDGDGVADIYDQCPDESGPKSNRGCPVKTPEPSSPQPSGAQGYPQSGVNIFFVYPNGGQGTPMVFSTQQGTGMVFDSDGDGIADHIDRCPNQSGTVENFGCPDDYTAPTSSSNIIPTANEPMPLSPGCPNDRDCDGISDEFDKCPDDAGDIRNQGCPITHLSPKWRREFKPKPVHFIVGKSFLTDYSRSHVDELINTMRQNPELNVWLFGHTDKTGNEEFNATLSEDRLHTIVAYMIQNGIPKERIYTMAFGESFPSSLGNTSEDLQRNRRVEFYFFEFK